MIRILTGDCREVLKTLPDRSLQCVVTSPPYFGLRDYGTATWIGGDPACDHKNKTKHQVQGATSARKGRANVEDQRCENFRDTCLRCGAERVDSQIGLEETPAAYVAEMVFVFREIWRVLRDDGVCWLNLGDSYAGSRCGPQGGNGEMADRSIASQRERRAADGSHQARRGAKPKELLGMPWRVAFALSDDGWYRRSAVIWSKPNPMPESCTDRPTTAHEYVFLLAKSGDSLFWTHRDGAGARKQPEPDYRWIHKITKEETATAPQGWPDIGKKDWRRINLWSAHDYFYDAEAIKEPGTVPAGTKGAKGSAARFAMDGVNSRPPEYKVYDGTRNARSVWTIATSPFAEAHFATFPPKLAETCILAGTSERGCCPACGAPWARKTDRVDTGRTQKMADGWDTGECGHGTVHRAGREKGEAGVPVTVTVTVGWQPTCACPPADPVPCVVLDPFGGAGTVAMVADRLQRDSVLIELNPEYVEIIRKRIEGDSSLLSNVQVA